MILHLGNNIQHLSPPPIKQAVLPKLWGEIVLVVPGHIFLIHWLPFPFLRICILSCAVFGSRACLATFTSFRIRIPVGRDISRARAYVGCLLWGQS